jgi:type II secretory pathway predicted ATPase ExeA
MESFYGFKARPFDKSIPSSRLWPSSAIKELSARLEYLKQNRGLMLLTGEPGVGKTAALRAFVDKLNPNTYVTIYTPLSTVNVLDFYRQLNHHLGGVPKMRKTELFLSIQDHVRDYVRNKKKLPIVLLDEAHLLSNDNLSELQIILNFEMDSQDPAILILCGQSHLRDRFHRPIHESINQRFRIKFHLTPLIRDEVEGYILHHLTFCGRKESPFTKGAVDAVFQNTAGNPRKINLLAFKTLTLGALEKKRTLSEEEVFKASREL